MNQAVETPAASPAIDYDAWRRRIRQDTFARYHLSMADALRTVGAPDEAVAAYRRAIAEMPDLSEAYFNLVEFLRAQGRDQEADDIHRAGLIARPGYDAAVLLDICKTEVFQREREVEWRKIADAGRRLIEAATNDPNTQAYGALALLYVGDIADGLAAFAASCRSMKDAPDQIKADYKEIARRRLMETVWKGRITWRDNTIDSGLAILRCARRLNPRDGALLSMQLSILLFQYRPEELLAVAADSVDSPAWSPIAGLFAAYARLQLGQWDAAETELKATLPLLTDAIQRDVALGALAYACLGKGDENGALTVMATPNDVVGMVSRMKGLSALRQGHSTEAVDICSKVLTQNPALLWYQGDLALCRLAQGDSQTAESLCRKALADAGVKTRYLAANDPWVSLILALALDSQGKHAEADAVFHQALAPRRSLLPGLLALLPSPINARACDIAKR